MLGLLLVIAFWAFLFFRWNLLAKRLGILNMYLFDAVLWTCIAAWQFAQVGPSRWFIFACGALSLWLVISSGRKYLALSNAIEEVKKNGGNKFKGSGGNNTGSTPGN